MRTKNTRGYGRGVRAETYVEPKLYALAKLAAEEEGISISTWLRSIVFEELLSKGKLDDSILIELAGR